MRALRGALDQLVVETIHTYCRRLLAAHPIEAGLHPRFEVDADGAAAAVAVREAVAEQLGAAYERGDEAATTPLGAGAYAFVAAKMAHYAWADDGTTIQAHGIGPFVINYVNPADDPATAVKK